VELGCDLFLSLSREPTFTFNRDALINIFDDLLFDSDCKDSMGSTRALIHQGCTRGTERDTLIKEL
jgi:hypothetical protein